MAIERVLNPGVADNEYIACVAAEGTTIPANAVVQLDLSAAGDGARVVQPNANELWGYIGVTTKAMVDGDIALVQRRGFRLALVNQAVGSQAPGLPLVPTAGQYYFTADVLAPANQNNLCAVLMETIGAGTPGTASLVKVWLK